MQRNPRQAAASTRVPVPSGLVCPLCTGDASLNRAHPLFFTSASLCEAAEPLCHPVCDKSQRQTPVLSAITRRFFPLTGEVLLQLARSSRAHPPAVPLAARASCAAWQGRDSPFPAARAGRASGPGRSKALQGGGVFLHGIQWPFCLGIIPTNRCSFKKLIPCDPSDTSEPKAYVSAFPRIYLRSSGGQDHQGVMASN